MQLTAPTENVNFVWSWQQNTQLNNSLWCSQTKETLLHSCSCASGLALQHFSQQIKDIRCRRLQRHFSDSAAKCHQQQNH